MVKSRFPGKPSKHFNRRKVSVINNEDSDGAKEAEDVYRRLSVFNMLFSIEDEVNSFHGFSPHETNETTRSPSHKSIPGNRKFRRKTALSNSARKTKSSVLHFDKDVSEKPVASSVEQHISPDLESVKVPVIDTLHRTSDEIKVCDKVDNKDDLPLNPTLSGKFVLPSRSAHSSRVIKPNKRFLQSENEVSVIPNKRLRLKCDLDGDKNLNDSLSHQKIQFENEGSHLNSCDKKSKKTVSSPITKSPVKFILRKPRLKIKSQPLSTMGGPFSSPGANSLSLQNLRYKSPGLTKVCCGVCGSFRTYRFFKQARKFGIFSCESCRRFILRIIRLEQEKSLKPLVCSSGTGSCPIRQSTLIAQPFSNETQETCTDEPTRCEACWLNLCLRSFHMPQRLSKRLSLYLPVQITQKTLISFDKCPTSNWSDPKKTAEIKTLVEDENLASTTDQQRLPRRNRVLRENINVRRGSNTSLRLSSHRGRGYNGRDEDVSRKGRTRQKLPLTGPRVKHVCRSASLVLGQQTATFLPLGPPQSSGSQNGLDESETGDHQETTSVDTDTSDTLSTEKGKKTPDRDCAVNNNNDVDYPPVARMLQDLGRANCELLDGMENHELEKQNARVAIDFWESYDPEEVSQMGFPLIGYNPLKLRALCFLCGSAGLEKMLHCSSCCEPYHMFCVSSLCAPSLSQSSDWWRIDWLCPKCTLCVACMKTGGSQLCCSNCHKSYHSGCTSTVRANMSDNTWVCPSCLFCKSCNDTSVHVFVGNMPLCKACFKLRKKGNFCPLCQCCYDDNDYNTKMMECAECKCWIHAQCEGISNEKYQVLSYLPSSVEFVCKLCCKKPPAPWALAVDAELRAGYLNVIKILSKNRNACALLKASPKKQRKCTCLNKSTAPIHLQNLMSSSETLQIESGVSPEGDIKTPDLGLLTPKLTKDDEESLKTVKSDFLKLVTEDKVADRNFSLEKELEKKPSSQETTNDDRAQLLSIVFDREVESDNMNMRDKSQVKDVNLSKDQKSNFISEERVCTCKLTDKSVSQSLSLLTIKNKASADEYRSVGEFHKDMDFVIKEIGMQDLVDTYCRCLKQIFPWFDSNDSGLNDSVISGVETPRKSSSKDSNKQIEKSTTNQEQYPALKGLLNFEPDYYYIGANVQDTRHCLLCKGIGEGEPMKEGRLLYCGQNDWVHTNCAMWSSEVFEEIDGSLQNVHSAISRARLIRCYECGKKGASLGCCAKSCPSAYHFICALSANCIFLDNKEIYCKAHVSFKGDKEIHREEDFHIRRSVYVELDNKKRKDVLRNEVRLYIGSLEVNQIGEIFPELSDESDMIIPCEFKCSRLYWSSKEPWKIVKYSIQTKITNFVKEHTCESDTNFTIDHSLEITPPPSPVDSVKNDNFINSKCLEKDVKAVVNHMLDVICSKEEDGNLSDQQNADLLPPEIKDAIFEDLPQDFLDRISVHDIFTKMSFDDILGSDSKSDTGESTNLDPTSNKPKDSSGKTVEKVNKAQNSLYKMVRVVKQRKLDKIKECESFLERENRNKWKRQSILQVDGAMDLSESDQSNDSCDVEMREENNDDKPVKCGRCHRTYRTLISYDRHLSTCNVDYPSCSESDLSEEEKTQSIPDENSNKSENVITVIENSASQAIDPEIRIFNKPSEVKTISANEQKVRTAIVQNSFENTVLCMENYNGFRDNSESIVNLNYSTLNGNGIHNSSFTANDQTIVTASIDSVTDSVVGLQTPTIIVQQLPSSENLLPTFISSSYQEPSQQPGIHYITAINTQEKAQFLSTNSMGQSTYHIQSPIGQPTTVVQNVPTVLGTIIQTNGVEQYLLNNTAQSVDVYNHQNNMYISNHQPMIVGMETVVSNTVMSSSRYISGSAPGPVLASSYSATTTQVFQAAKPLVDIPQGYLLVNTNPPQIVADGNSSCLQNIIQNGTLTTNPSWNSYKIDYQDSVKLNKNITYQAISQQIMSQKQEVNGVKLINANEQSLFLTPIATKPSKTALPARIGENAVSQATFLPVSQSVFTLSNNNSKSNSLVKVVELPSSSAVYKEKPQQAVAPVVIKKIPTDSARRLNDLKTIPTNHTKRMESICKETIPISNTKPVQKNEKIIEHINKTTNQNYISDIPIPKPEKSQPTTSKIIEKNIPPMPKPNGLDHNRKRKVVHEEPKISFEITSEDGFSYSTTNINEAWTKVFETVQFARKARNLPPLAQNPFSSPDSMLKKLMGLGNNSMKYLLEQLPGISSCSKYKPVYHRKTLSALEKELSRGGGLNPSGCARTEKYLHCENTYDMFSWLASRHRRPPKLLLSDSDGVNGNSRRATSMNLPMAMRFRHLKETSKVSVGVFRSDIHGRGLFCLRDIDAGEMVIEYAGEVIRSALTDKRERYYTEKGIGCYMFRIDDKFVVDATMKGNAARFINHSCEPNCYSRVIDILGKKHILIFALRRILQGEELTYDYKFPLEEEKINCHCLSRKCRKYLN